MSGHVYPVRTHGYGGYSRGCRCGICKAAKAAYMAGRRANPGGPFRHGTRFGYEERRCRCVLCAAAKRATRPGLVAYEAI